MIFDTFENQEEEINGPKKNEKQVYLGEDGMDIGQETEAFLRSESGKVTNVETELASSEFNQLWECQSLTEIGNNLGYESYQGI